MASLLTEQNKAVGFGVKTLIRKLTFLISPNFNENIYKCNFVKKMRFTQIFRFSAVFWLNQLLLCVSLETKISSAHCDIFQEIYRCANFQCLQKKNNNNILLSIVSAENIVLSSQILSDCAN